ncbi:MAG TPA: hypothetical protein VGN88_12645, partial [Phycisphaerae bacterium]
GNPTASATVTNLYDYNRDGAVNAGDQGVARANGTTFLNALNLIYVPSVNLLTAPSAPVVAGPAIAPPPPQPQMVTTAVAAVQPAASVKTPKTVKHVVHTVKLPLKRFVNALDKMGMSFLRR